MLKTYEDRKQEAEDLKTSINKEMIYATNTTLQEVYKAVAVPSLYKVYDCNDFAVIEKDTYEKLKELHPEFFI